jgi:hypothetical protein
MCRTNDLLAAQGLLYQGCGTPYAQLLFDFLRWFSSLSNSLKSGFQMPD